MDGDAGEEDRQIETEGQTDKGSKERQTEGRERKGLKWHCFVVSTLMDTHVNQSQDNNDPNNEYDFF